jgi:hypothetical protein
VNKLSGDTAEARLAKAWETILSHDPAGQEIIHVLAQPTGFPAWIDGSAPFGKWMRNDGEASSEIWHCFASIAESWSYIKDARQAAERGIPNTRIIVVEDGLGESAAPWLRYLCEIHLPAISAMSGESLYLVQAQTCRASRIPVRGHDANIYGAAGVMLAGGDNGEVEWRAFLADEHDPDEAEAELGFVTSMRDLAITQGVRADLPAEIRLNPAAKGRSSVAYGGMSQLLVSNTNC